MAIGDFGLIERVAASLYYLTNFVSPSIPGKSYADILAHCRVGRAQIRPLFLPVYPARSPSWWGSSSPSGPRARRSEASLYLAALRPAPTQLGTAQT